MIEAKTVKILRDKTGAGMMDCKNALTESGGDIDRAIDVLRKSGIAKAEKKGSRDTKEGLIYSYIHHFFPSQLIEMLLKLQMDEY